MNKVYFDIVKKIKEYGTIIIHRHSRPDGDAIGSQIGLREAIKTSFPYKKVYVVGDENEKFTFLGNMDIISDDVYKQALVIILDSGDDFLVSDERFRLGKYTIKIDHHMAKNKWCDLELIEQKEDKQKKVDKWKKEAQAKIKLFKQGKLDEDTLYKWMEENTFKYYEPGDIKDDFKLLKDVVKK